MTLELYADLSNLSVSLAQFLMVFLVRLLIRSVYRIRCLCLEHMGSNESDNSSEEESDELGSGLGSFCTCDTGLGGLLCGVELSIGVTFSGDGTSFFGGVGGR